MLHLVIDANAYLDFYRMAAVDLDELQKLVNLLDSGQVKLYVTDQVLDEVKRNREKVIFDSLKAAREMRIPSAFPQILRSQPLFGTLDNARTQFSDTLKMLIESTEGAARSRQLGADLLLDQLFSKAERLRTTDDVRKAAATRMMVGNPPGKAGSHGDAISWEALLDSFPASVDLHFVTRDQDFVSPLDGSRLCEFLVDEWANRKASTVFVYENLRTVLSKHYRDIQLAAEEHVAKDVARLVRSGSFATTHAAIKVLADVFEFTTSQVLDLCKAGLKNDQISSIMGDPDVGDFYWGLMRDHRHVLDGDTRIELLRLLDEATRPERYAHEA